jgi:hypothetical protein
MIKPQIVDISYARISTGNTSQLSSLGNQFKKLKDLERGEIITHVGSGDDEFSDDLKNKILSAYNNKNDVRINIIAFDRLTRNFKDLDFLKRHVRYIYVLDDDRTFDLKIEIDQVAFRVAKCVQELDIIRNRFRRNRNSESRKRSRDEIEDDDESKVIATKRRCLSVSSNMKISGLSDEKLKDLEIFVRLSQKLDNPKKWKEMFSLMKNLGLNADEVKEEKYKYAKYIKNDNTIYEIQKKDLIILVTNIVQKNSSDSNQIFINQFINSNMRYGKQQ